MFCLVLLDILFDCPTIFYVLTTKFTYNVPVPKILAQPDGPAWSNNANNLTDPVLQFFFRVSVLASPPQLVRPVEPRLNRHKRVNPNRLTLTCT